MKDYVLLVEDNEDDIYLMAMKIGQAGFKLLLASDQKGAFSLLNSHLGEIELVLMDGGLAGSGQLHCDTLGLIIAMRETGFEGRIISTTSNELFIEPMKIAGCDSHCPKGKIEEVFPQRQIVKPMEAMALGLALA